MPYRCVHCSQIYEDSSKEVLTGCGACGSKFFFYLKKEKLQEILDNKIVVPQLTEAEKDQIEKEVREIAGIANEEEDEEDEDSGDERQTVFLDFESVRVIKPGKYLLDIQKLFSFKKPKVYQLEDGKYIVDLAGTK